MSNITLTREQVVDGAERAGVYEYEIQSYSGRYMSGERCLGIVVDDPGQAYAILSGHIATVAQDNPDSDQDAHLLVEMARGRLDSMGRDVVVYWPGIELETPADAVECCADDCEDPAVVTYADFRVCAFHARAWDVEPKRIVR